MADPLQGLLALLRAKKEQDDFRKRYPFAPVPSFAGVSDPLGKPPITPFIGATLGTKPLISPVSARVTAPFQMPKPLPPGTDVLGGLKVLGEGLVTQFPTQVFSKFKQLAQRGSQGASVRNKDENDYFITYANERAKRFVGQKTAQYGEKQFLPGIKITDVAQLPQNIAYSAVSGGIGTAVGAPFLLIPGAGGWAFAGVTGGVSGKIAFDLTSYEIMQKYLEMKDAESLATNGRGITLAEENKLKASFESEARKYGLWEAIPEGVSNLAGAKLVLAPLTKMFGGALTKSFIPGLFGATGGEFLTETMTQKGQAGVEFRAGMRENIPSWFEAFKEIAPQTTLLLATTGGAGATVVGSAQAITFLENEIGSGHPQFAKISATIKEALADERGSIGKITPESVAFKIAKNQVLTKAEEQLRVNNPQAVETALNQLKETATPAKAEPLAPTAQPSQAIAVTPTTPATPFQSNNPRLNGIGLFDTKEMRLIEPSEVEDIASAITGKSDVLLGGEGHDLLAEAKAIRNGEFSGTTLDEHPRITFKEGGFEIRYDSDRFLRRESLLSEQEYRANLKAAIKALQNKYPSKGISVPETGEFIPGKPAIPKAEAVAPKSISPKLTFSSLEKAPSGKWVVTANKGEEVKTWNVQGKAKAIALANRLGANLDPKGVETTGVDVVFTPEKTASLNKFIADTKFVKVSPGDPLYEETVTGGGALWNSTSKGKPGFVTYTDQAPKDIKFFHEVAHRLYETEGEVPQEVLYTFNVDLAKYRKTAIGRKVLSNIASTVTNTGTKNKPWVVEGQSFGKDFKRAFGTREAAIKFYSNSFVKDDAEMFAEAFKNAAQGTQQRGFSSTIKALNDWFYEAGSDVSTQKNKLPLREISDTATKDVIEAFDNAEAGQLTDDILGYVDTIARAQIRERGDTAVSPAQLPSVAQQLNSISADLPTTSEYMLTSLSLQETVEEFAKEKAKSLEALYKIKTAIDNILPKVPEAELSWAKSILSKVVAIEKKVLDAEFEGQTPKVAQESTQLPATTGAAPVEEPPVGAGVSEILPDPKNSKYWFPEPPRVIKKFIEFSKKSAPGSFSKKEGVFDTIEQANQLVLLARYMSKNAVQLAQSYVRASGNTEKAFGLLANQMVTKVVNLEGRSLAIGDVLSNPTHYELNPEQLDLAKRYGFMYAEAFKLAKSYGVKISELPGLDEFSQFIARRVVGKINKTTGVVEYPPGSIGGFKMGAKIGSQKERMFEEMIQGIDIGLEYASPEETLSIYIQGIYRLIGNKQAELVIAPFTRPITKDTPVVFGESRVYQPALEDRAASVDIVNAISKVFSPQSENILLKNIASVSGAMTGQVTAFDISAPALQGLPLLGYDIQSSLKGKPSALWAKSFADMARIIADPGYIVKFRQDNFEVYKRFVEHMGKTTQSEFVSGVPVAEEALRKIPIIGKPISWGYKHSWGRLGAGYSGFLESGTIRLYAQLEPAWVRAGENLYDLGSWSVHMLGSTTKLGMNPNQAHAERIATIAPNYIRASFLIMKDLVSRGASARESRDSILALIAAGIAFYYAEEKLRGQEPKMKPWAKKFGGDGAEAFTTVIGGQRVGVGGFLYGLIRLGVDLIAMTKDDPSQIVVWNEQHPLNRFLKNKRGVAASLANDLVTGKNFYGQRYDSLDDYLWRVAESITPISAQSQVIPSQKGTPIQGALEFTGLRVFPYSLQSQWKDEGKFLEYYDIPAKPVDQEVGGFMSREQYRQRNPDVDARLFLTKETSSVATIKGANQAIQIAAQEGIDLLALPEVMRRVDAIHEREKLGLPYKKPNSPTDILVDHLLKGLKSGNTQPTNTRQPVQTPQTPSKRLQELSPEDKKLLGIK